MVMVKESSYLMLAKGLKHLPLTCWEHWNNKSTNITRVKRVTPFFNGFALMDYSNRRLSFYHVLWEVTCRLQEPLDIVGFLYLPFTAAYRTSYFWVSQLRVISIDLVDTPWLPLGSSSHESPLSLDFSLNSYGCSGSSLRRAEHVGRDTTYKLKKMLISHTVMIGYYVYYFIEKNIKTHRHKPDKAWWQERVDNEYNLKSPKKSQW